VSIGIDRSSVQLDFFALPFGALAAHEGAMIEKNFNNSGTRDRLTAPMVQRRELRFSTNGQARCCMPASYILDQMKLEADGAVDSSVASRQ